MSYLNSGRLNLSLLRDVSRSDLFALLDSMDGTKAMVWDSKLVGPFGLISDYSLLKEHKVTQMLEFRAGTLPNISTQNLIYFIRPLLSFIDIIADTIKLEGTKRLSNVNLHIVFIPRKCLLCERKLEALGVLGDITSINEYSPDFYVLDSDMLSIEWPLSFKECVLEMDYSSLYQIARSIMTLQCLFGVIPSVCGIGQMSKHVYDMMAKMKSEITGVEASVLSQIDQLILIDRSIDLLTPMVYQVSYEGMLDEIYGINQTVIRLPPEKFVNNNPDDNDNSTNVASRSVDPPTEMKRFYLNSGEDLFKKLRDVHYFSVGPILRSSAKSLANQFDERKMAKSVREIRQFVDKIPYLQKLRTSQANHTSMAELIREVTDLEEFHDMLFCENELLNCFETDLINPYIETCISRGHNIIKILRLISIQSFCGNGLKPKTLDFYKREILQTYGYQHMLTCYALEKCGLIRSTGNYSTSYSTIRNRFKLTWNVNGGTVNSSINGNNSADIGHVHNGYTPLTVRLVQHIDQFGFRSLVDVLSRNIKLDNSSSNSFLLFDETQNVPHLRKRRNSDTTSIHSVPESGQKTVLVLYIGGCTFSEISSLRMLSHKEGVNSDFLVGTTSIINGRTFLQSLVDFPLS